MSGLNLSRLRVLIVDDNPLTRDMIRFSLHALGIRETQTAGSGARGLELLELMEPDLVLLDWVMEEPPDGLEVVRRVRADTKGAHRFVPIVMLTAYADAQHVQQARDAGANEFVAKPFAARTLYCKIRSLVENPRPFIEVPSYFGPDRRRHAQSVDEERRVAVAAPPAEAAILEAALAS